MKLWNPIPEVSKAHAAGSNEQSKQTQTTSLGTLYALQRRMAERVKSIELEVSTLRRDVNATRRKVYREESPESFPTPQEPQLSRDPGVPAHLQGLFS